MLEDALEVRGILRVRELARPRQVKIVEARNPEAQRGRPQHRPAMRRARSSADGRVRTRMRSAAPATRAASSAPSGCTHQSFTRDRDVVEQRVGAREIKIDHAARSRPPSNSTLSRNRSAWIAPRGRSSKRCCAWNAISCLAAAPRRPAAGRGGSRARPLHQCRPRGLSMCAGYVCRRRECARAWCRRRCSARCRRFAQIAARQKGNERCGLAVELAEKAALAVRERTSARYAVIGEDTPSGSGRTEARPP